MGCGSSKATVVHQTNPQQHSLEKKTVKPSSQTPNETKTSHQNGDDHHITATKETERTIAKVDHSDKRISNGHAVTPEQNNKENNPNSRTSNGEVITKTERRPSHGGVAFEVKFGDENANLRTQKRPPKLKKLEHLPVLTAEMLAQKQALAEENRQKEIEKKLAKTSRRKKKLLEARELDMAAQAKRQEMEEKMNAQNRKRARAQAEIVEKQKRRELKARRVRERAQRIKEGGDGAEFEIDPDETYNADEENDSWDTMETNDTNTVSSTSSTIRKQSKPTLDSDDEVEDTRAVHDFFEE